MPSLTSSNKIKARHFHCPKRIIDDLCSKNDGEEFGKSFFEVYPKGLKLKFEN